MKHHHWWLGLLVFIGVLVWGQPVSAQQNQYFNDHTNTLAPATLKAAQSVNQALATLPGQPTMAVEVYNRIPNQQDIDEFKVKRFEQLGIGQKGWDNGLYFVLALRDQKYALEVGYGLEAALPDGASDHIITTKVETYLRQKQYDAALQLIMGNLNSWLQNHRTDIATPAQIKAQKAAAAAARRRNTIITIVVVALGLIAIIGLLWWHRRQHALLVQAFDQTVACHCFKA